jgi:FkbM family methyltransferase
MKHEIKNFLDIIEPLVDLNNVNTILDLGSRDAEHAVSFSEFFPNAKIYTFECNPYCIDLCEKRLAEVNNVNIKLIKNAVFNEEKILNFYPVDMLNSPSKNHGASSLFQINPDYWQWEPVLQEQKAIEVKSIRLDNYLKSQNVTKVDIVWADLQGAELFALQGLGNYIKDVIALQAELEWKPQYLGQPLANEVIPYLENNNFKFIKHNGVSNGGWFSEIIMCNKSFLKSS